MKLDCKAMTGIIYHCPNLSECLQNSPLNRMEALTLYFLNQGVKPEDIEINGHPYQDYPLFIYNQDSNARDNIIFGHTVEWEEQFGGTKNFYNLSVNQLQRLIEQGFANPRDTQNIAPPISAFLAFGQRQNELGFEFNFEGYAVSPLREDYRVSIDGIRFRGNCSQPLIQNFRAFAQQADELDISSNYLRAWWD